MKKAFALSCTLHFFIGILIAINFYSSSAKLSGVTATAPLREKANIKTYLYNSDIRGAQSRLHESAQKKMSHKNNFAADSNSTVNIATINTTTITTPTATATETTKTEAIATSAPTTIKTSAATAALKTAAKTNAKSSEESEKLLLLLHDLIAVNIEYPAEFIAERNYAVYVQFDLFPDGRITNLQILQSSSIASLDGAAREAIAKLQPHALMQQLQQFSFTQKKTLRIRIEFAV